MKSQEITKRWIDFFVSKGHTAVPSASLVSSDPSLLFTVAGMVPFIPYLTAREEAPYQRATSVQKCIRTGDIEEVGKTARHGTFFQMCGNFSFGDYFKEDAIKFAWELLTTSVDDGGYGLPPERLWVTVYEEDDEAEQLWLKNTGMPAERIQRMGKADNYWSTGQPGPAGPCSEIYYDRGPSYGVEGGPHRRREPLRRNLEPRVHAVPDRQRPLQGGLRHHRRTAQEEHRHRPRHGTPRDDPAGRREHVRDRPGPPRDRQGRRALRPGIHLRRVRRGPAPHRRRPHARRRRPHPLRPDADRRRRHPLQRGPRLRAAPPDPPRRALHAPARRRKGLPAGTAARLPRRHEGRLPDRGDRLRPHQPDRLRRGEGVPAHHRLRHRPPRGRRQGIQGRRPAALRRRRLRPARHLRLPDRPHPRNGRGGRAEGRRARVPQAHARTAPARPGRRQGQEGRPRRPQRVPGAAVRRRDRLHRLHRAHTASPRSAASWPAAGRSPRPPRARKSNWSWPRRRSTPRPAARPPTPG